MDEKKATVEFRVNYKWNGSALIDGQTPNCDQKKSKTPIARGRFASFQAEEGEEDNSREDAAAAVKKCKDFFNTVRKLKIYQDVDEDRDEFLQERKSFEPDRKDEIEVTTNEIVHVWIDEWRDGKQVVNGDPTCAQESNAATEVSDTSSTETKSPKPSTGKTRQVAVA